MALPVEPPLTPMLARAAEEIPAGAQWLYEPKWDGFRTLAFCDGGEVTLLSRNNLPLARYFPDVVEVLRDAAPSRCVLDGEVVIAGERGLDFDALQLRLHPAESRVRMLAGKTPASFVAFDILALDGDDLRAQPLHARRATLTRSLAAHPRVALTPQTGDREQAERWFEQFEGAGLDGVMAKDRDGGYVAGERLWIKVKHHRTADCVVGGYRVAKNDSEGVASLLLGLYREGTLHYVGHTSSFSAAERRVVREKLRPLEGGESFGMGRAPGGPSRWSQGRDQDWVQVRPELVCEVRFEQMQSGRFRHAARFLRWRPDKSAQECGWDQVVPPVPFALQDVVDLGEAQRTR